jgi:protein-tyrosine phosphatase
MDGFIDLHCHPIPGIDDGAKSAADGMELLAGLRSLGFARVVATPHIRSGLWENRAHTIAPARAQLEEAMTEARSAGRALPELDVAAEHLFDDVVWELFAKKEAMPYPGGTAALVEFPYDNIPHRVELRFWRLNKSGITPVLAHPERYAPLARDSERLHELIGAGARPLLDLMSLVGTYGRAARAAAERMLDEKLYSAACSDAHKPSDVPVVAEALRVLQRTVGDDEFRRLLITSPRELLQGRNG